MRGKRLSVFAVDDISYQVETDEITRLTRPFDVKDVFKALLSCLAIIAFCVFFAILWTIIPRTNSIIYQSYWMEVYLPVCSSFMLSAGTYLLDLIHWTKEKDLRSIKVYLKMFFVMVIPCFALYIVCYVIWSVWLEFNHPLPYLAIICLMLAWLIFPLTLWSTLSIAIPDSLCFPIISFSNFERTFMSNFWHPAKTITTKN